MTGEIDFLDLILNASIVVQAVMLVLVLASVVSWYLIIDRSRTLSGAREQSASFEEEFWSGKDLATLYKKHNGADSGPMAEILSTNPLQPPTFMNPRKTTAPPPINMMTICTTSVITTAVSPPQKL